MHELPGGEFPSGGATGTVPVVLPLTAPAINTGIAGGKSNGWLGFVVFGGGVDMGVEAAPAVLVAAIGLADALVVVAVTLMTDGESATAAGEQLTLVPGIVGSSASGGEASVVTGAPGTVDAENRLVNGLGPPRGDEMIAPGVVGSASSVVPMVDICAAQVTVPSTSIVIVLTMRMANLLGPLLPFVMSLQAPAGVPPSPPRRDRPSG